MRQVITVTLFGLLPFLTACTYNRGLVVSSADRGTNDKVVGIVRGHSEKDYILFGLFQPGDDSLGAAFIDAIYKSSVPAQGLINVFAEKYCTYYLPPIFWSCGTSLTGAAIQYVEMGEKRLVRVEDIPSPSRPDPTFKDCPQGQSFRYGQCYPLSPGFGGPK